MQAFVDDLERSGSRYGPDKFSDFRKILNEMNDKSRHPSPRYFVLKSIILNNLYGVDIMEEATEICKLRLFLKLVAQINLGERIEPLPDIDFNIKAGNTLIGFATEEELHNAIGSKLDYDKRLDDIKERAELARIAYEQFRQMQIEERMSPEDFQVSKRNVQSRLDSLRPELDDYLAGEQGIKKNDKQAYELWRRTHRPFHWLIEFHGIFRSGGFDVIIGNPPYVEYRLSKVAYRVSERQFQSYRVGNLYAFCMERSSMLLRKQGFFGMIVPVAVLGLDEAAPLRGHLLDRYSVHFCSGYSIRPAKLFEGVDQRLCIYLSWFTSAGARQIFTTRYHHWSAEEREDLFPLLHYALSYKHPRLNRIVQIGQAMTAGIMNKVEAKNQKTIGHYYASPMSSHYMLHYHRSPRYWIRAMDFEQYFKSPTRSRSIHHFRDLNFSGKHEGKFCGAALNSSLFFLWFLSIGNGRNLTGRDVSFFPIGELEGTDEIEIAFGKLMKDYQKNSFVRVRQDCEFQEFRPSLSKPIMDTIDRLLAIHYGFDENELDFVLNFEVKYRLGVESEVEEEDAESSEVVN
jgi:hypothetical protein